MHVSVLKDEVGFPSIVEVTKGRRKLKVTTDPNQGFTIEAPRSLLPDPMDAFRVVMPRVSYQKTVDEIQGEDNTEVSYNAANYELKKVIGVELNSSRNLTEVIATFKALGVGTAYIKITYEVTGGSETTWLEESIASQTYVVVQNTLQIPLEDWAIIRVYLKASAGETAYNKQLTVVGDVISIVGHLF